MTSVQNAVNITSSFGCVVIDNASCSLFHNRPKLTRFSLQTLRTCNVLVRSDISQLDPLSHTRGSAGRIYIFQIVDGIGQRVCMCDCLTQKVGM